MIETLEQIRELGYDCKYNPIYVNRSTEFDFEFYALDRKKQIQGYSGYANSFEDALEQIKSLEGIGEFV